MALLSPADELAEIRLEMLRLRKREAVLRRQILNDPEAHTLGRWHRIEVEVEEHQTMVFDISLLPDKIRNDHRYLRVKQVFSLHCLPMALARPLRPGWPIRRDFSTALH